MTSWTGGINPPAGDQPPAGYWAPEDPIVKREAARIGPLLMMLAGYLAAPTKDKPPLQISVPHDIAEHIYRGLALRHHHLAQMFDIPPEYEERRP